MLSAKKPGNIPSRHSLALDDRSSQILNTSSDRRNRDSSLSGSGSEEEKPEVNDNREDHLREFETSEFPPEPPLDASRTSLVSSEDMPHNGNHESSHVESTSDQPSEMKPSEETKLTENRRSFQLTDPGVIVALVGLLVLLLAVFLELKYSFIRKI